MSQAVQEAGKYAGYNVKVSPSLANISRNYWQMNESFFHFGLRMAKEHGASFKVVGNTAVMLSNTDFLNADGVDMGGGSGLIAEWGVNLIAWRIKPFVARPQMGSSESEWFNVGQGMWEMARKMIGGDLPFGRATNVFGLPAPAPNRQVGEQNNEAAGQTSESERGTGFVVVNGEPEMLAGKPLTIIGARPGVDGTYKIAEAQHSYSRRGYITRCDLMNPQLNAAVYRDDFNWGDSPSLQEKLEELGRRRRHEMAPAEGGEPETAQ
jgi:hypothetical protein